MADAVLTIGALDEKDRKVIVGFKRFVSSVTEDHEKLMSKARDNAAEFIKTFKTLDLKYDGSAEVNGRKLGGFVGFVRLFVPGLPMHPRPKDGVDGYQADKTYNAMVYMRRIATRIEQPARRPGQATDPAVDALARALKTAILLLKGDMAPFWEAVRAELFSKANDGGARAIARLQKRVEATEPVIDFTKIVKPVTLTKAMIVHLEPKAAPATAPEAAAGGRVHVGRAKGGARAAAA